MFHIFADLLTKLFNSRMFNSVSLVGFCQLLNLSCTGRLTV